MSQITAVIFIRFIFYKFFFALTQSAAIYFPIALLFFLKGTNPDWHHLVTMFSLLIEPVAAQLQKHKTQSFWGTETRWRAAHTHRWKLNRPVCRQSAAVRAVHDVWAVITNLECDQELAAGGGGGSVLRRALRLSSNNCFMFDSQASHCLVLFSSFGCCVYCSLSPSPAAGLCSRSRDSAASRTSLSEASTGVRRTGGLCSPGSALPWLSCWWARDTDGNLKLHSFLFFLNWIELNWIEKPLFWTWK